MTDTAVVKLAISESTNVRLIAGPTARVGCAHSADRHPIMSWPLKAIEERDAPDTTCAEEASNDGTADCDYHFTKALLAFAKAFNLFESFVSIENLFNILSVLNDSYDRSEAKQ